MTLSQIPTLSGLAPAARLKLFSEDPTLEQRVRDRIEEWVEGQPFESELTEEDDVAESILEVAEAKSAALIAIRARERAGADYFLTGTVAEKIVRASPIPVMTVK